MKNYRPFVLFTVFAVLMTATIPHTYAASPAGKAEVTQGGKRKKNGTYKKKRGFFKRLFKGKNACDCPKYK